MGFGERELRGEDRRERGLGGNESYLTRLALEEAARWRLPGGVPPIRPIQVMFEEGAIFGPPLREVPELRRDPELAADPYTYTFSDEALAFKLRYTFSMQAVSLPSVYGIPVCFDRMLEPDEWYLFAPRSHAEFAEEWIVAFRARPTLRALWMAVRHAFLSGIEDQSRRRW